MFYIYKKPGTRWTLSVDIIEDGAVIREFDDFCDAIGFIVANESTLVRLTESHSLELAFDVAITLTTADSQNLYFMLQEGIIW